MSVERQLLMAASGVSTQYTIAKSLRFRSSASAYLNRTPSVAGNQQIHTISLWTKYSTGSADRNLISFGNNTTYQIWFGANGLNLYCGTQVLGVSNPWIVGLNNVFRDPSAWYNIVIAVDTTQATASNRVKIYVNGVQQTSLTSATYPTQNYNTGANSTTSHSIGRREDAAQYYDGYLAEINFIDGQALTPSSFGETSSTTGVWIPKRYSGTYGTNGFYLKFTDTTSTTALGNDSSGNGNNWTPNNISLTTGATYDSMLDSPTNYDNGGNGVGNYAVLNPLNNGGVSLSSANLTFAAGSGLNIVTSTISPTSGKWYWEANIAATYSIGVPIKLGILPVKGSITANLSTEGYSYDINGNVYSLGTLVGTNLSYASGDVIGYAFDVDSGTLSFYKNNTLQTYSITGITNQCYAAGFMYGPQITGGSISCNFGQRPFAYTPPTGFKALNTQNLPTPSILNGAAYMAATTYTGTGASLSVSGAAFQPDLVWIKSRSAATDHALYDVIRGTQNRLESNTTDAAVAADNGLTAFNSNGFTVNTLAQVNTNAATYVGWQWKAGGTAVTNTAGSITSQVSANTTAGFSVVTLTTQASGTGTFGHGLGVAPSMVITKFRAIVNDWYTYHSSVAATAYLQLNTTSAATTSSAFWNNTAPTSSVVTLGSAWATSNNMVAYCFAAIPGYSAFGSYTGNGSTDGPFVYCGFRPRWVMYKCTSASGGSSNWVIQDTSRNPYNSMPNILLPNLANAELTDPATTGYPIDCLSNGFKIRNTNQNWNTSGGTYIYAAFAENPFQNARAR